MRKALQVPDPKVAVIAAQPVLTLVLQLGGADLSAPCLIGQLAAEVPADRPTASRWRSAWVYEEMRPVSR